jgi:phosphoribosylformylglycinamidine (FGAM) synthase PurS component
VAIVVIEVMPKKELLDPAGKAVSNAIRRGGVQSFAEVRIGKRFELHVVGEVTPAHLDQAKTLANDLLSNGVIEDVVDIRVEDSPA